MSIVAITFALTGPHTGMTTRTNWGTTTRPTVEALVAGCGPLAQVTNPRSEVAWIDRPQGNDLPLPYETTIPAAGWFYRDPPSDGEVAPAPEAVLREMWAGGRVAWYSADVSADVVQQLRQMADSHPEWSMRVAQWPVDREAMPGADDGGARVAFATWGATQTCDRPTQAIAEGVWRAGTPAPGLGGGAPAEFSKG